MTAPRLFHPPNRRWLWLFVVLLPVALFAVIREKKSWQPVHIKTYTQLLSKISWLDNNYLSAYGDYGQKGHLIVADVRAQNIQQRLPLPSNYIHVSHFSSAMISIGQAHLSTDAKTVCVGGEDEYETSKVWTFDFASGKLKRTLKGSRYIYLSGTKLYTCEIPSLESTTKLTCSSIIYDLQTGQVLSKKLSFFHYLLK